MLVGLHSNSSLGSASIVRETLAGTGKELVVHLHAYEKS